MANLQYVKEVLKKANPNAVITQGYLRNDIALAASNANLTFQLLQSQNQSTVKCMPLQAADGFCVTAMSIKIYKSVDGTPANIAQTIDFSYPNPKVFTKAGEASNLESIFNGYMSVTIQKKQIFSQFPMWKFRRVNTSQQGSQTGINATPAYSIVTSEEQNGAWNGLVPLEPTINLQGGWTCNFQVIPPASLDLTGTSSTNYISLILDGFLLQNCATYDFSGLES